MQPPSQFLELLARHHREVGALDIVQLWGESARHIERKSHSRQSASPLTTIRPRPSPPHPIDRPRGDVNGYRVGVALPLGDSWRAGLLAALPIVAHETNTPDSSSSSRELGSGDAFFEGNLIRTINERWAYGFGARLHAPTAEDTLGSGKCGRTRAPHRRTRAGRKPLALGGGRQLSGRSAAMISAAVIEIFASLGSRGVSCGRFGLPVRSRATARRVLRPTLEARVMRTPAPPPCASRSAPRCRRLRARRR